MRFTSYLTALALAASSALAAMNTIINKCDFDVWLTTVGKGDPEPALLLGPGVSGTELQFNPGTGVDLKFTHDQYGLYTSKPVLHFSYSYDAGKSIYYSISTDHGFDFGGKKITLKGENKDAPSIEWDGVPGPIKTEAWVYGELNLTFTMCA